MLITQESFLLSGGNQRGRPPKSPVSSCKQSYNSDLSISKIYSSYLINDNDFSSHYSLFFPPASAVEGIKSVPSVCLSVRLSVCPSVSALTPEPFHVRTQNLAEVRRSMGQEYWQGGRRGRAGQRSGVFMKNKIILINSYELLSLQNTWFIGAYDSSWSFERNVWHKYFNTLFWFHLSLHYMIILITDNSSHGGYLSCCGRCNLWIQSPRWVMHFKSFPSRYVMVIELYKEEDTWLYNIGVWKILLNITNSWTYSSNSWE